MINVEVYLVLKEDDSGNDSVEVCGQQREVESGGRRQPQHGRQADVEGQLGHGEGRQKNADLPQLPPDVQQLVSFQQHPEIGFA